MASLIVNLLNMRKLITVMVVMLCFTINSRAQRNEIFSPTVKSLQVVANDDWLSPPVMTLGGSNYIHIDFDDLSHTYKRFIYKVEHCEADWSISNDIFESDYMEGFDGNPIEDFSKSINTTVLYTHYALTLPNSNCRLKLSGNYRLTVYDEDNNNEKVLTACFLIVEPKMGVSMQVNTNTDIDVNLSHQQVDLNVSYGNMTVTDPMGQICTVVLQNGRWDQAVINAKANYVMNNQLVWTHNRSLIFDAGNEYHKFEMLDVHHPTLGVDKIDYVTDYFHCILFANEPRINYVYDEDADGSFYIRNSDNQENDIISDYLWVHYTMKCDRVNGNVYVNGAWTNDRFLPEYLMAYNDMKKCYEASILQKQGYYSYQYVVVNGDGKTSFLPAEGSFYQTENKYQALVYFKGPGERTYKLVGYSQVQIKS